MSQNQKNPKAPKSAGFFYPASKIKEGLLEKGLARIESELNLNIFLPPVPPTTLGYAIASKEERLQSLLSLLERKDLDYIWAARGGYGSVEILESLSDYTEHLKNKLLIGFSDITALHAHLSNLDIPSLHAHMPGSELWLNASTKEVHALKHIFEGNLPAPLTFSGNIHSEGRLVGGNLTTLASLMGTPWALKLKVGDILFLEDVAEGHYRLARSLFQLSHTNNFSKCTLLWGHLTACRSNFKSSPELIASLMSAYKNPYGWGLLAGHENPNHPLRLGASVRLKNSILEFSA